MGNLVEYFAGPGEIILIELIDRLRKKYLILFLLRLIYINLMI
jgi:hypothetical protein